MQVVGSYAWYIIRCGLWQELYVLAREDEDGSDGSSVMDEDVPDSHDAGFNETYLEYNRTEGSGSDIDSGGWVTDDGDDEVRSDSCFQACSQSRRSEDSISHSFALLAPASLKYCLADVHVCMLVYAQRSAQMLFKMRKIWFDKRRLHESPYRSCLKALYCSIHRTYTTFIQNTSQTSIQCQYMPSDLTRHAVMRAQGESSDDEGAEAYHAAFDNALPPSAPPATPTGPPPSHPQKRSVSDSAFGGLEPIQSPQLRAMTEVGSCSL